MWFRHLLVTTTALLAVTGAADALAQARVQGKVTDQWGNGLAGVEIQVERTDGGGSTTATTEESGDYIILGVTSGDYELTYLLDGYQGIRTAADVRMSGSRPIDIELEALPTGGRLRGEQEFEAAGGSPTIRFSEDGLFEFEDADGEEGEGTYGIVEQSALLVVRDYDGNEDKYSITEPVVVTFTSDQFTSLTWDGTTLTKK